MHCFYGSVLWELNNNNNDFDYKDVKKVVTFNRKWVLYKCVIINFQVKLKPQQEAMDVYNSKAEVIVNKSGTLVLDINSLAQDRPGPAWCRNGFPRLDLETSMFRR